MNKACTTCKEVKLLSEFWKNKSHKDGLANYCKDCGYKYEKMKYSKFADKIRQRQRRRNKMPISKEIDRKRNKTPRRKEWRKNYQKTKRETDMNFRLRCNLSSRIATALMGSGKSKRTKELIGCDIPYLRFHLEKQFQKGMTWENYGLGAGKWTIDHILPCASFDLTIEDNQLKCFNYQNLQPMWFLENCSKNDKLPSFGRQ